jgi:hypothetical protein
MPDLQTALSKVITEWETPDHTPAPTSSSQYFKVTNNISRITFEHIRDNPGLPRSTLVRQLAAKGFKTTSTSSIMTQMLRQGMIKLVNGGMFANQPEYTPIKPSAVRAARTRRTSTVEPVKLAKRAPPKATPPAPAAPQNRTVNDLMHSLSIADARELYDKLHQIFNRA